MNDARYMTPVRSWTPRYPSGPGFLMTCAIGCANVAGSTRTSQKIESAGMVSKRMRKQSSLGGHTCREHLNANDLSADWCDRRPDTSGKGAEEGIHYQARVMLPGRNPDNQT